MEFESLRPGYTLFPRFGLLFEGPISFISNPTENTLTASQAGPVSRNGPGKQTKASESSSL